MDTPHKHNKPSFSLNDFKNWLSQNGNMSEFFDISNRGDNKVDEAIGKEVQAKVSGKKLLEKIEVEEGEPEDLVEELIESRGMILSVRNNSYLVEVESGSFYIPKFCVRVITD